MSGIVRSLLCRLGLHKWSTNRGGITVCRRDDCRKAQTFGMTGAMRKMEFERELYEDFQRFEDERGDR